MDTICRHNSWHNGCLQRLGNQHKSCLQRLGKLVTFTAVKLVGLFLAVKPLWRRLCYLTSLSSAVVFVTVVVSHSASRNCRYHNSSAIVTAKVWLQFLSLSLSLSSSGLTGKELFEVEFVNPNLKFRCGCLPRCHRQYIPFECVR